MEVTSWKLHHGSYLGTYIVGVTSWNLHHGSNGTYHDHGTYLLELEVTPWNLHHGCYLIEHTP